MKIQQILLTLLFGMSGICSSHAQWTTSYSGIPGNEFDVPYIYMLSPVDSQVVWAVLARGYDDFSANRFLRTSDGGASWKEGLIPDNNLPSYTINIFGVDSLTAWTARVSLPEEHSFLYKTTDGGSNWVETSLPFSNDTNILIAVHFFNALEGVVYAETNDGTDWYVEAYYTDDGGGTWQTANTPRLAGERIFIWHGNNNYAVQGDTIWFGTSLSRVFRSSDKGKIWEAITVPTNHVRPLESIAFQDANNGIVATALSDSLGGTLAFNEALRTEDGGETWTHIPIPIDLYNDPRLVGLSAIPGSNGVYMLYGYLQSSFEYKQMTSQDNGMTWYYVDGAESKTRCLKFSSPQHGWGGGFDYAQSTIIEKIYKWTGPPLIKQTSNSTNEWNRLQSALNIGPNPCSDQLHIQILDAPGEKYLIEIYYPGGQLLYSGSLNGQSLKTLSVKNWPTGTHILKVSGDRGMTARAVIKQ